MAPPPLPLRHYTPKHVTEDTPPDLLEGTMELEVTLPNGKVVNTNVHRSTPMMDILIQVTTAHRINPGGHVIQVISDNIFLSYKPSTPIGTLDTNAIKIVAKNSINEIARMKKSNLQQMAIERNIRLKVNLPRNQLAVYRVTPKALISDIFSMVCEDKNLDMETHEIRHPVNVDERLRGSCTLSDYQLQEVCVVTSDFRPPPLSVTDLITMSSIAHPEDKKRRGFLGLFSRKAKSSTGDSSMSSGSAGERSVSPARSDESAEAGRPTPQALSAAGSSGTLTSNSHYTATVGTTSLQNSMSSINSSSTSRLSRPASMLSLNRNKKRPAPVPPQRKKYSDQQSSKGLLNGKVKSLKESNANLSRHSSDSSGYHEPDLRSVHASPSSSEVSTLERNKSSHPATAASKGKRKAPPPPKTNSKNGDGQFAILESPEEAEAPLEKIDSTPAERMELTKEGSAESTPTGKIESNLVRSDQLPLQVCEDKKKLTTKDTQNSSTSDTSLNHSGQVPNEVNPGENTNSQLTNEEPVKMPTENHTSELNPEHNSNCQLTDEEPIKIPMDNHNSEVDSPNRKKLIKPDLHNEDDEVDTCIKQAVEPPMLPEVELRVEPNIHHSVEPNVELTTPNVVPTVEPNKKSSVEAPVEPNKKSSVEAPVDSNKKSSVEAPVDSNKKSSVEAPVDSNKKSSVEAPVEPFIEPAKPSPISASITVASENDVQTRTVGLSSETSSTSVEMVNPKDIQRPKRQKRKKIPEEFLKKSFQEENSSLDNSSSSSHSRKNFERVDTNSEGKETMKNEVTGHRHVHEVTGSKDVLTGGTHCLKEDIGDNRVNEAYNKGVQEISNPSVMCVEAINEEESSTDPPTANAEKKPKYTSRVQLLLDNDQRCKSVEEKSDRPAVSVTQINSSNHSPSSDISREDVIAELKSAIESDDRQPRILNVKPKGKDWNEIKSHSDYNVILSYGKSDSSRKSLSTSSSPTTVRKPLTRSCSTSSYESTDNSAFKTEQLSKARSSTESSYESAPPPPPESIPPHPSESIQHHPSDSESKASSSVVSRQSSFSEDNKGDFAKPKAPTFSISTYKSRSSKVSYEKKLHRSESLNSFKDLSNVEEEKKWHDEVEGSKLTQNDTQMNQIFKSDDFRKKSTSTTFLNMKSSELVDLKPVNGTTIRPSFLKSHSRSSLFENAQKNYLDNAQIDTVDSVQKNVLDRPTEQKDALKRKEDGVIQFELSSAKDTVTFRRPTPKNYDRMRKTRSTYDIRGPEGRAAEDFQAATDSGLTNEYMRLQDDFMKWQEQLLQNQQLLHNRVAPIASNPPTLNSVGMVNNMMQQPRKPIEINIPIRFEDDDEDEPPSQPSKPVYQPARISPVSQGVPRTSPANQGTANAVPWRSGPSVPVGAWQERPVNMARVQQPEVFEHGQPFARQPAMQSSFQTAPYGGQNQSMPHQSFQQIQPQPTFQEMSQPSFQHMPQSNFQQIPVIEGFQQIPVMESFQQVPQPNFQQVPPQPGFPQKPQQSFQQGPQPNFQQIPQSSFQNIPQPNAQQFSQPAFQQIPQATYNQAPQKSFQNVSQPNFKQMSQPNYQQPPQPNYQQVPQSNFQQESPQSFQKVSQPDFQQTPQKNSQFVNRNASKIAPPRTQTNLSNDNFDDNINARFSSVVTLANDKDSQVAPQKDKVRSVVQLNNDNSPSHPAGPRVFQGPPKQEEREKSPPTATFARPSPISSRLVQQAAQQPPPTGGVSVLPQGGLRISPPKFERQSSPPKHESSPPFGDVKLRHVETRASPPSTSFPSAPSPPSGLDAPPPPPPPPSRVPPPPPAPGMSDEERRTSTGKRIRSALNVPQLDAREELMMAIRQFGGSNNLRRSPHPMQ